MDERGLQTAKATLRSFAAEHGMGWVLEELDEAVALGVVQAKALRPASRKGHQVYEEVPAEGPSGRGRKRAEEFLTRRPMTDQEQVEALIGALRRALLDIDSVAQEAVEQLSGLPSGPPVGESLAASSDDTHAAESPLAAFTRVEELDFLPDEGGVAVPLTTERFRHADDRRATVGLLLDQLLVEVRQ